MTQYIDKAAVVAEIERLEKNNNKSEYVYDSLDTEYTLKSIISFIDTLEVKEVDLDEAARKWEDKVYLEKGWQDEYGTPHAPFSEIGNAFMEGAKFIVNAQKGE